MKQAHLTLTGKNLKISDVIAFCDNPNTKIKLHPSCQLAIEKSREFLNKKAESEIIYGVNTGFGPMANRIITGKQLKELQNNLILSHACGMGDPVSQKFVLATMIVRLNTLLKGFSGITWELAEFYAKLINFRIIPLVPEHGAVGTSGDLVQLSHIALVFLGKGQVFYRNAISPAEKVFSKLKIKPHTLQSKEGLALINGTSFMTGVSVHALNLSQKLIQLATLTSSWSLEVCGAFDDSIDPFLSSARPHEGQKHISANMSSILKSSRLLKNRQKSLAQMHLDDHIQAMDQAIQEVYSLRCASQILGPVLDTIENTKKITEIEMNSATDNPLVDLKGEKFVHGGNFHGDYISAAIDSLKAAIVKLTMLSERRINFFLNPNIQKNWTPFLNLHTPGLTLALQGLQFVATSTTALSQSLAYPHHLHSISTNGDNQDVVSMGADGALLASKVIENAFVVLSIEVFCLAQATDLLSIKSSLSEPTQKLYNEVRAFIPKVLQDRPLSEELNELVKYLKKQDNIISNP